MTLRFAKKAQSNPIYARWFKQNPNPTSQRCPLLVQEQFARTERLYNSPLFAMRRLLNNTPNDTEHESNFMDLAHLFDDL